jgi:YfiH family protein
MNEPFRLKTAPNGVSYIMCARISAPHGFSTRLGGESAGAYATLNLGVSAGDDEPIVRRNRAAWAAALGMEGPIAGMHQVHGGDVHTVAERPRETLFGDAIVTAQADLAIGVYTADCTPILLHDPITGAVGAVHAGWKGTVAHVVVAAVKRLMLDYGAKSDHLVAAIGPAIGPCCFEVGPDVVARIEQEGWPGSSTVVIPREGAKPTVDLFEANRSQLIWAGLAPENVHVSALCTFCHADMFYSWRREHGHTGRMQAAISCTGSAR